MCASRFCTAFISYFLISVHHRLIIFACTRSLTHSLPFPTFPPFPPVPPAPASPYTGCKQKAASSGVKAGFKKLGNLFN